MKINLFILIIFFIILPFSASAEADSNDTNNEYSLNINNQTYPEDSVLNISADQTVKFKIWDSANGKFTTEGKIEIGKESLEIKSSSILDKAADVIKNNTFGGTVGDNSECYVEYSFKEIPDPKTYSLEVKGVYNSIPTTGKLTINVKSNYITASKIGKTNKTYESKYMTDLTDRNLKYHKYRDGKNADDLIKNINDFLAVSDELNKNIDNLTNHSDKAQLDNLPVNKVLGSKLELEKSIKTLQDQSKNDPLIKEQLTDQLNSIKTDINNISQELAKDLNTKNDILLKNELKNAQALEEKKINEFSSGKSNLINEIFYPAGLLIILGFIIGYFNVNRWKKESEYFGLYTSKANIMNNNNNYTSNSRRRGLF
jgi:hypothetical protein